MTVHGAPSGTKGKGAGEPEGRLRRPALGLEAEFSLTLDGTPTPPERVFMAPTDFLRKPVMHRVGTSYHLPNGGAIYFDTGVIEMVTPAMELERGVAVRAARSLWENIELLREDLDAWERRAHHRVLLAGFSTHYNVSVSRRPGFPLERLAKLLTYLLPAPLVLLAANKRSTGIGVRPRQTRIEVTADFTPDPALHVAAATFIAGVVRHAARWPEWTLAAIERRQLPVIGRFAPRPHSSRQGWLAGEACYPRSPFTTPPDAAVWQTQHGTQSLRAIAERVFDYFRLSIARVADPFTLRLIAAILGGRATSLLDLPDRPPAYEDVGRLCRWSEVFPAKFLRRSRYERVLMLAIAGTPLAINGEPHRPVGMRGWSQVWLRRLTDGRLRLVSVDDLVPYLDRWT